MNKAMIEVENRYEPILMVQLTYNGSLNDDSCTRDWKTEFNKESGGHFTGGYDDWLYEE